MTRYAYGFNVDGYGPSSRLRTQLAAGILVFKVDSVLQAHYMEGMKPWVHYIPVSWGDVEDDLPRKVEWAIAHDNAARRIAEAGRKFARERLTDANTAWYMQQVVEEFGRREGASGEPFELLPGAAPFCCAHLQAYNISEYNPIPGMDTLEFYMNLCNDWTAGWEVPCPVDAPNAAAVAFT